MTGTQIFALLITGGGLWAILHELRVAAKVRAARSWPTVPGEILVSEVMDGASATISRHGQPVASLKKRLKIVAVVVGLVAPRGQAKARGVLVGDEIVSYDGKKILERADLRLQLLDAGLDGHRGRPPSA